MKKHWLAVAALVLLVVQSLAHGEELPWEKKLPFKEATIPYQMTGSQQGSEILYIKDYGKLRAKHHKSTMTMMGVTNTSERLEITDPDWVYVYDLVEKKGEKTTSPAKIYQAEYNKLSSEEKKNFAKNSKELGTTMLGQFGGSIKQNSDKVLGYDCDVVSMGAMTTGHLIHNTDIPLRNESKMMGFTMAATKVDTSSPIPGSAFAPPAGITATLNQEADSMMNGTIKHMIDTLKKPDGAKQLQQAGPMGMMMAPGAMEKGMEEEGMSKEEQQEMMQQMQQALEQMQKQKPMKQPAK